LSGEWARRTGAVVCTLSVVVTTEFPAMVAEEEELPPGPRVQVGGCAGLIRLLVTEQERLTTPSNPAEGVTEIVEELPEIAPELTVILPLLLSMK